MTAPIVTYATVTDVANRLGRTPSDDLATLIQTRLGDAERLIRRRFKGAGLNLDTQISSGLLDVQDVVQVESDAVLRLARNPDGYNSETDGTYTYQIPQALIYTAIEIEAGEWEILGIKTQTITTIVPQVRVLPNLPPWAYWPYEWVGNPATCPAPGWASDVWPFSEAP